jgi:DNA-binding XRE family transcriptional regulator
MEEAPCSALCLAPDLTRHMAHCTTCIKLTPQDPAVPVSDELSRERIQQLYDERILTQKEIAELFGVSTDTVKRCRDGKPTPKLFDAFRIKSAATVQNALVADGQNALVVTTRPLMPILTAILPATVITMPPLNSSGDVYHLAAYLFWCISIDAVVPLIVLTQDAKESRKQANYMVTFARQLGLGAYFFPNVLQLPESNYRPAARQEKMAVALANRGVRTYWDHHVVTTVLCSAVCTYGRSRVAQVIRDGLRGSDPAFVTRTQLAAIHAYVDRDMANLHQSQQPLVVFHLRIPAGSNSQQTFDDAAQRVSLLEAQGYRVAVIYADGRTPKASYNVKGANIIHLRPFQDSILNMTPGLVKLAHVHLLLRLYDRRDRLRLCGIIGNTSGTLDVAAFMGHHVLDVHHFAQDKQLAFHLAYQDWRLLLQGVFMHVRSATEDDLNNIFVDWLHALADSKDDEEDQFFIQSDKCPIGPPRRGHKAFFSLVSECRLAYEDGRRVTAKAGQWLPTFYNGESDLEQRQLHFFTRQGLLPQVCALPRAQ